jgi:hypothetical protein
LERFLDIWDFWGWSEKGNRRKCTKNRVTSWTFMFWGNLRVSRCFAKRIRMGEFRFDAFLSFGRGSTGGY